MKTILLVEDDALARESETYAFQHAGYHVFGAASLTEAALYLERGHPDLVLLDMRLPDGDGAELGKRLRTAAIPFMILSGYPALRFVTSGFVADAADYVLKPIGVEELLLRVAAVISQTARPQQGEP